MTISTIFSLKMYCVYNIMLIIFIINSWSKTSLEIWIFKRRADLMCVGYRWGDSVVKLLEFECNDKTFKHRFKKTILSEVQLGSISK